MRERLAISLLHRAISERRAFSATLPILAAPSWGRARSAACTGPRSCGSDASEALPFPGADSIFSSRCGAISGRLRFAVSLSRRDPGDRIASVQKIDDRLGISSGSRAAPAACRAFLLGVRGIQPAHGTGSRKIAILSAFCEFSRLCRAENFRLDLAADPIIRATGVRPGPEATSPIVSRPDALSARPIRAHAGRRAGLVAAI